MADRSGDPESAPHARPRWVKTFGIAVVVLVVVAIILLIAGGHGPGRHAGFASPVAVCDHASPCGPETFDEVAID